MSSSVLSGKDKSKALDLFKNMKKNDEYEIAFNNFRKDNPLGLGKFMSILKYLKYRSEKTKVKLESSTTLDVSYNYMGNNSYRVTINGLSDINNFLNLVHSRKNHIIFSILMGKVVNDKDVNFTLMNKIKSRETTIDVLDYDVRIRKSAEESVPESKIKELSDLNLSEASKISYRFKQRVSYVFLNDKKVRGSVDLTVVMTNSDVNKIKTSPKNYELEIDFTKKTESISSKYFDILNEEISRIKKFLLGYQLYTNTTKIDLIGSYLKKVYGIDSVKFKNLYSMNVVSTQVVHILDKIPTSYSVTDKTDGERYSLYIVNDEVWLISNNLEPLKTNIKVKNLNGTVLEGELVYLEKQNKYLFMIFDCSFLKDEEVRSDIILKNRIEKVYDVMSIMKNKVYKPKEYSGKYDLKKIEKFNSGEIENFYKFLNNKINDNKTDIIIHPKFFLYSSGGSPSEIFNYAYNMYNICTKNINIECPYMLDGIIFTGLEQRYTSDKSSWKYPIYKYKPPDKNSLDVYIKFEKNRDTGGYQDVFDNSVEGTVDNQIYRLTKLYVGDSFKGKEVPVPFMEEENNHIAYFPLVRGQVRDIDGNMVQDDTVIEIIYVNNENIPHNYRWQILRTRWDKTESVKRFEKKYGNFKDVAINVWRSMTESVKLEELKVLADPNQYLNQRKLLQDRLSKVNITSDRSQDKYYQKTQAIAKKMRDYNNFMKSCFIYSYASKRSVKRNGEKVKKKILDFGCGRGGDLMKFYSAKVGEYVGFDTDYQGLFSSADSITHRYKKQKAIKPGWGKYTFIQADGGVLLNSKDQDSAFGGISKENKILLDKTFNKKNYFDMINGSFSVHYMFKDDKTLDNLVKNINDNLKQYGYIMWTMFDAHKVLALLGKKGKYVSTYTDDDGKRNVFFEIRKLFEGDDLMKTGLAIDVHMSWISNEGVFQKEYLVTPEFMIKVMKERCNARLVETESFENFYHMNKPWFDEVIHHEVNPNNKRYYERTSQFYGDLKGYDKESRTYSHLNRFYVFQKM